MQEKALLRLEGTVENIVYRNDENGYTVLEIIDGDNFITAVGVMPPVNSGDRVALTGMYTAATAGSFPQKHARSAAPPKRRISSGIFPPAR